MNLSWVDWTIIILAAIALRYVSSSCRTYMKGVADFLSANRSAGRYLLTVAGAMGGMGVISFVALCQLYMQAGFTPLWWNFLGAPIGMIIILTGWVYWRFRETRALTMAQFFEMRYSRRFRIFAGVLCWACGVLNFGIFPAVAANFFIYFCGLPLTFHLPGVPWAFSTFATVMALDLGVALIFVTMGGQISVMVTECAQGIMTMLAFLVIIAAILLKLHWSQIAAALSATPPEASMLNPYHTLKLPQFNIWFYLIGIFGGFYGYMSWQGTQGYFSAGKSPHEQRMSGVISTWRLMPQMLVSLILPLAAVTVLTLPHFAGAAVVHKTLASIPNPATRDQMRVPIVLAHFLPVGVKGLLAMTMLFFSFTCHDTYMHSWGSIFIQDVLLPVRAALGKGPLSPKAHVNWLRASIIFVAVFAFCFSLWYVQSTQILMFFAITGTIWAGGSGSAIIGGLYWKRGTTAGAYSALLVGAVTGVCGLFADQIWRHFYGHNFPIDGQVLWFLAMVSAIVVYFIVSLITSGTATDVDMDKLLHRGQYAASTGVPLKPKATLASKFRELVGIRTEYTFTDKIWAVALVVWNFGWLAVFLVVSAIQFTRGLSDAWWASFWHFYMLLLFGIAIPAAIWFSVGGIRDIRALFQRLATAVRDPTDDGRVVHELPGKTAVAEGRSVALAQESLASKD